MNTKIRSLILLAALLLLAGAPTTQAQTGPDRTCSADTTAWLQGQVSTAIMAGIARNGGRLTIPAGCYRIDGTVAAQRTDNNDLGYSLILLGDGPGNTVFRGPHPFVFHQLSGGEIGQFSLEGTIQGPNYGIAFNRTVSDLGSCCFTIHDVVASGYGNCFMFGDIASPYGAAADIVGYSLTANSCGVGYRVAGNWNDLDVNCTRCSVNFSPWGWLGCGGAGCGTQMHILGGGGTGVMTPFNIAEGDWLIQGTRWEGSATATQPLVMVGGGGSTLLTMQNNTFLAGQNASGAYVVPPVAVDLSSGSGGNSYHLYNNAFPGRVKVGNGSLDARGNHVYGTGVPAAAFELVNAPRVRLLDNCSTASPNGICGLPVTWWTDRP